MHTPRGFSYGAIPVVLYLINHSLPSPTAATSRHSIGSMNRNSRLPFCMAPEPRRPAMSEPFLIKVGDGFVWRVTESRHAVLRILAIQSAPLFADGSQHRTQPVRWSLAERW